MHTRPKVPTMQYGRVARDGIMCVRYIRAKVVSRVYGRLVDDRNRRALFNHTGYREKLPDRLLALAWVPINGDDLSKFVYTQCASKLNR